MTGNRAQPSMAMPSQRLDNSENAPTRWSALDEGFRLHDRPDHPSAAADDPPPAAVTTIPGLKALWAETLGDSRICVAILDGPVDRSHAALAAADLTCLTTLVPCVSARGPAAQHGTHIASVIFGQHDGPIKGIAPRCRGLIVPVFQDGPDGGVRACSQVDLARAIGQAVEHGAHVINISAGQFSPSGTAHPILADAVKSCADRGTLIVSATGNNGCECLHVPGAMPSVLPVGAMNAAGEPLPFSNWGHPYEARGVLAPGEDVLGALPGGGVAASTGTSPATAVISAIAALLLSVQLRRQREPDANAVRAAILGSAIDCAAQPVSDCRRVLAGRLNVSGAVTRILRGGQDMPEEIVAQPTLQARPSDSTAERGDLTAQAVEPSTADTVESAPPPEQRQSAARVETARAPRTVTERTRETDRAGSASAVEPSACACAGAPIGPPQLVFALGLLGYDFGTDTRRDSIAAHMDDGTSNPEDPSQLLAYLDKNPWDAESVIWTLNLNETPIYAILPEGAYAADVHQVLRRFLAEQLNEGVERVSVPGVIIGDVPLLRLLGGKVPIIRPNPRGMYSWTTMVLIECVCGKQPASGAATAEREEYDRKLRSVRKILDRVYFDSQYRNLGVTAQERALNYAVTNAFQIEKAVESALQSDLELDTIEVERSGICRSESDCWDVQLFFYHPQKQLEQARSVYQFTVDVSDEVPVMVGPMRSWSVR